MRHLHLAIRIDFFIIGDVSAGDYWRLLQPVLIEVTQVLLVLTRALLRIAVVVVCSAHRVAFTIVQVDVFEVRVCLRGLRGLRGARAGTASLRGLRDT